MAVMKKINTVSCSRLDDALMVGVSEVQLNKLEDGELTAKDISESGVPDTALLMLGHSSEITMDRVRAIFELVALNLGVNHVFYIPLFQKQNRALREGKNVRIDLEPMSEHDLRCIYMFYGRTEAENEWRLQCRDLGSILEKNCVVFGSNKVESNESTSELA